MDSNYDDICQRHITFDKDLPKWNYKVSWRDKKYLAVYIFFWALSARYTLIYFADSNIFANFGQNKDDYEHDYRSKSGAKRVG